MQPSPSGMRIPEKPPHNGRWNRVHFRYAEGNWRIDTTIHTPEGILTQQDEANDKTTWTVDYLIKRPEDMLLVKKYLPVPKLDQEFVRNRKRELGESGILRGWFLASRQVPGSTRPACSGSKN